jgi:hypothetical protein
MGRFYNFLCDDCGYNEEWILEGRGRLNNVENVVGTCKNCKRVFTSKGGCCKYCETKYRNLRIIQPVKFYSKDEIREIKCPNCNQDYLKINGSGFWD